MGTKLHKQTRDLLKVRDAEAPVAVEPVQTSLAKLASSTEVIANFIAGGGLVQVMQGYARAQSVSSILNGLVAKEGRAGLDPRVMKQNAIETAQMVETFFDVYSKKLKDLASGQYDPELKDADKDFNSFEKNKEEVAKE